MPVNVLNGRPVAPGDLLARHTEYPGNPVALAGTWCPAAKDNGKHTLFVQTGFRRQLLVIDPLFLAKSFDRLGFHAGILA